MSVYTGVLALLCPVCDVKHGQNPFRCSGCDHVVCDRCKGCSCATMACDCKYGREPVVE